jgi:hypothetical protein
MNFHICLDRTTQNTVCDPLYLDIGCAATLTVSGIQWLTSSLLCDDTKQLIQRSREKKRGNRFKGKDLFACSGSNLSASVRRYANCARWKKFLQKCEVVGLTCTSLFFRVNNSVPN